MANLLLSSVCGAGSGGGTEGARGAVLRQAPEARAPVPRQLPDILADGPKPGPCGPLQHFDQGGEVVVAVTAAVGCDENLSRQRRRLNWCARRFEETSPQGKEVSGVLCPER